MSTPPGPPASIAILHEDEHLLVVAKPAGLLSVPDLPDRLGRQGYDVQPVHRLDRDVSGALILARDEETRGALEEAFRLRTVDKTYWALAAGHLQPETGALHFPLLQEGNRVRVSARGRKSLTRYRTLAAHPTTSEVEIELVTGRTNQIRVHFAHAGHPLVGERKYARGKDSPVRIRSRRVALHAWRIGLDHPADGRRLEIEAPLPADLVDVVGRARG